MSAVDILLGDWDKSSSVRSRPQAYDCLSLADPTTSERDWFFRKALPYLENSEFRTFDKSAIQSILAANLVYFLEYTTLLEHRVVNRSVESIAHRELPVRVPEDFRCAALRIYVDEGYHAMMSSDVALQVRCRFALQTGPSQTFPRIERLTQMVNEASKRDRPLIAFLVGFVAETVITRALLEMARPTLIQPVFRMLRDHLDDEWRHSHYFSELFQLVWKKMTARERAVCSSTLPRIILECFSLDDAWLAKTLDAHGVSSESITSIITDRRTEAAHRSRARDGAKATLAAINLSGMLASRQHRIPFIEAGLLPMENHL